MPAPLVRALTGALGSLALLASCAAPTKPLPAAPRSVRITSVDWRNDIVIALVNDAWLEAAGVPGATPKERRVEFASISRDLEMSTTKVLSDAQVEQVLAYLESDCGWDDLATGGPVARGGGLFSSSIEIEVNGATEHAGFINTMGAEQAASYVKCKLLLTNVHAEVYSLQTVHNLDGFREGSERR